MEIPSSNEPISFLQAMLRAVKLHDETTAQFAVQIKRLTDADKAWFKAELIKAGYKII